MKPTEKTNAMKLKTFEIQFENGEMTIIDKAIDILSLLKKLENAGWKVSEITNIKNV